MEKSKLNQLVEILSIPSYFGMEWLVQDYLIDYGQKMGYTVDQDEKGNVYFVKGEISDSEYFPCVCAHIDTVYNEHTDLIKNNQRKDIRFGKKETNKNKLFAYMPGTDNRTGIGGDDLAGVFICLQMMKHFDTIKAAFFVEEEYGCKGSNNCDELFFHDVGYVIQFDGPTGNWFTKTLSGVKMYTDEAHKQIKPLLEKYNVSHYSDDPYTDILPLKEKFDFCCFNLPTGYYDWHSKQEYVNIDHVQKGIELGIDFINTFGKNKQQYDKVEIEYMSEFGEFDWDVLEDEIDLEMICENCGDDLENTRIKLFNENSTVVFEDVLKCTSCGWVKDEEDINFNNLEQ